MIKIGDHVTFKDYWNTLPESLIGETGIVESIWDSAAEFIVKLDHDVPGFYSGTAWVNEFEMEIVK